MPLELDTRQRAMLQEMGVQVWLPGTAFAPKLPLAATLAACICSAQFSHAARTGCRQR
jgi:hypothetical protein